MLQRILLIEDSEGEALYVKQSLREAGLEDPVFHLDSSSKAMAYLNGEKEFADRKKYPIPDIILLDLNLPDVDGYQFLRWLRGQPELSRIIVVVLTGEINPKRIQMAYQLGANSFLGKGANPEEFKNFVEFFKRFSRVSQNLPKPTVTIVKDTAA